jgi:hypothetical protein
MTTLIKSQVTLYQMILICCILAALICVSTAQAGEVDTSAVLSKTPHLAVGSTIGYFNIRPKVWNVREDRYISERATGGVAGFTIRAPIAGNQIIFESAFQRGILSYYDHYTNMKMQQTTGGFRMTAENTACDPCCCLAAVGIKSTLKTRTRKEMTGAGILDSGLTNCSAMAH